MSSVADDFVPSSRHADSDPRWQGFGALVLTTFLLVLGMNVAHEAGHALAAKLLGYDLVASINHVRVVPGAARSQTDRLLIDLAGPLVTLMIAIGAWLAARRGSSIALSVLVVALAMRIIAAVASLGTPNDEARAGMILGIGQWTLFGLVIAILLALFVGAWRRSRVGWRWFLGSYIGASIGFATTVFGEPYLPTVAW